MISYAAILAPRGPIREWQNQRMLSGITFSRKYRTACLVCPVGPSRAVCTVFDSRSPSALATTNFASFRIAYTPPRRRRTNNDNERHSSMRVQRGLVLALGLMAAITPLFAQAPETFTARLVVGSDRRRGPQRRRRRRLRHGHAVRIAAFDHGRVRGAARESHRREAAPRRRDGRARPRSRDRRSARVAARRAAKCPATFGSARSNSRRSGPDSCTCRSTPRKACCPTTSTLWGWLLQERGARP